MRHLGRSRVRWAGFAGLYMFVCATATAYILHDLLGLLADVIGLPAAYSMVILASPALVIGAVVWWTVVERREAFTYRLGAAAGFVTALLTGLLWTVRFVGFWGFEMLVIPIIAFLVVFVLGLVALTGVLTGLPLMYARRRFDGALAGGTEPAV